MVISVSFYIYTLIFDVTHANVGYRDITLLEINIHAFSVGHIHNGSSVIITGI